MIAEGLSGVDASVARLRAASTELAATLIELDAHRGRSLLDPAHCAGATAARATVALDRLAWLWDRYLALFDLLTRADTAAARRGGRRREQLTDLLRTAEAAAHPGPPHPEPEDPPPGSGASDEMGLAAIARTVARVRTDFDAVVNAHQAHLAILAGAEELLARLVAEATRIGSPPLAELGAAAAALAPLSAAIAADPLGLAARQPIEARAALDRAAASIDPLVRAYDTLDDGLRDAATLLDTVVGVAADGERDAGRAAGRIRLAEGELLRLPEGWLDDPGHGLRPWLERLRGLAAGPPQRRLAAVRGLAAWTAVAEQALAQARHVAEANTLPLRRRDELRGLLGALRQKAVATGQAEDPALEQSYAGARDVLYTAPTDLTLAQDRVTDYASALNGACRANNEGRGATS
ncbi:conserved hypothetical protein [Frankia sp. AiPs1]|uniref:hypothetical protein n=1 Tax=Frankia sp. AiPa1 TaxID=573492 RepID=UPI00202B32DA|nr:hypothetical protein [Frankia sp. AiPa1]MCL9759972.1 hypothetical protein [Frankia sp. AiPa1]